MTGLLGALTTGVAFIVDTLVAPLSLPVACVVIGAAGALGSVMGNAIREYKERRGKRLLARVNLPHVARIGHARGPGVVAGSTAARAAEGLVGLLLSDTRTVVLEGESGLGKSTIVRAALNHPKVRERFTRAQRDRRIVLDFDEIDRSLAAATAVIRERLTVSNDTDAARDLSSRPSVIMLDHVERFFVEARTNELDALLGWLARDVGPATSLVLVVQGHRARNHGPILALDPTFPELQRLDLRDALEVFGAYAPSVGNVEGLDEVVGAFAGLPRCIHLLACAIESEVTSPLGTELPEVVLARYRRRILEHADVHGLAKEGDDVVRNLSVEVFVDVVLDSHLVTETTKRLLVQLWILPAGVARDVAGDILDIGAGPDPVGLQAEIGQAHLLGLVHSAQAGVAAEPAVAMRLISTSAVAPSDATRQNWVEHAVRMLTGVDSLGHWRSRNVPNLHAALREEWPGTGQLALALLANPTDDFDEATLIQLASTCDIDVLKSALDAAQERFDSGTWLPSMLILEALASANMNSNPEDSVKCLKLPVMEYDRRGANEKLLRALTTLRNAASEAQDEGVVAESHYNAGLLALRRFRFDTDVFDGYTAAALYHLTEAFRARQSYPELRWRVLVELTHLAMYYARYPPEFSSTHDPVGALYAAALAALREAGENRDAYALVLDHAQWLGMDGDKEAAFKEILGVLQTLHEDGSPLDPSDGLDQKAMLLLAHLAGSGFYEDRFAGPAAAAYHLALPVARHCAGRAPRSVDDDLSLAAALHLLAEGAVLFEDAAYQVGYDGTRYESLGEAAFDLCLRERALLLRANSLLVNRLAANSFRLAHIAMRYGLFPRVIGMHESSVAAARHFAEEALALNAASERRSLEIEDKARIILASLPPNDDTQFGTPRRA